jgi:hypothetical protein
MKNKKINELTNPPVIHPSEEEQLAILKELINGSKKNQESLKKILSDLKEKFGE